MPSPFGLLRRFAPRNDDIYHLPFSIIHSREARAPCGGIENGKWIMENEGRSELLVERARSNPGRMSSPFGLLRRSAPRNDGILHCGGIENG
jgi:hypothetical protein